MAVIDNNDSNIIRQELNSRIDPATGKRQIHLRTEVSADEAIRQVQLDNENGGRIGSGSDEMMIACEIPSELWAYDPLLKKAMFYKLHGEKALYVHYLRQFMKLNQKLCPVYHRRVFTTK